MRNRDMKMVSEVIGNEMTLELMTKLGGMCIYIPKPSTDEIEVLLKENGYDSKTVAVKANVSLRKVYQVLADLRKKQKMEKMDTLQMSLYPEDN